MFLRRLAIESNLQVIKDKQSKLSPAHIQEVKKVTLTCTHLFPRLK